MWDKILARIDELYEETVEIRRYLHQYPELSFKEEHTPQFIADTYEKLGIPYQTKVGGNGVVAKLQGGKPGKTIALRADFDALPIQEENDFSFKSKIDGVMHACGHDGHTATLLTVAKAMKEYEADLPGTVVFIHQHAEEFAPGGAKPMVEAGVLKGVDAVYGTHLWTDIPYGSVRTSTREFMAGSDRFEITIKGKGGHGAQPHQTKDAVVIASQLVTSLQQIISRRIDPLSTAVLTIGSFHAGNTFNIIADQAKLTGTVRIFDMQLQDQIIEEMEKVIKGVCIAADADYVFDYLKGYPPVINHPEETERVLKAAAEIEEVEKTEIIPPSMVGEDFSYYLQERPGAFYFTGAMKEGHHYPHHHPKFDIDERAMRIAGKTLVQIYRKAQ